MADADTTVTGADPMAVEGTTEGADGDFMVIPALVGVGATLSGIYSAGRLADNVRFWNDYYKNTGYRPKYPWRSGEYDSMRWGASFGNSFGKLKRL